MELREAEALARGLMTLHGVGHLAFAWNRRRRASGTCRFNRGAAYRIELSRPLTELRDEATVRNTILHEIAHALAGAHAGHGWRWRATAVLVGARPERCGGGVQSPGRYRLRCKSCGYVAHMYRRPSRRRACADCCNRHARGRFDTRFVLELEEVA